jgi:hypothetical protein
MISDENNKSSNYRFEGSLPVFDSPELQEEKRHSLLRSREITAQETQARATTLSTRISLLLLAANVIALSLTAWQAIISRQASQAATQSAAAAESAANTSRQTLGEIQKSDQANIDQFRIDNRAWVVGDVVNCQPIHDMDGRTHNNYAICSLTLRNVGRTLAKDVVVRLYPMTTTESAEDPSEAEIRWVMARLKTKGKFDPDRYEQLANLPLPTSLAPGASTTIPARFVGTVPPPDGVQASREILFGRLEYRDIFEGSHWDGLCYVFQVDGSLRFCLRGNTQN